MRFVISDIHGNYEKYCEILDVIGLQDDDVLYVLGDVTDRGENGIKILQDIMRRPNVIPILGNHDMIAWRCLKWLTQDVTEETIKNIDNVILQMIDEWFKLGGDPTVREFMTLSKSEMEDYELFGAMPELRSIYLYSARKLKDIWFIEQLTKLRSLMICHSEIEDLELIKKLMELQNSDVPAFRLNEVAIIDSKISDVSVLETAGCFSDFILADSLVVDEEAVCKKLMRWY